MANLRCLTIKAKEPFRLADFYRSVFELKTVSEDAELIRLSDGIFRLALLKEADPERTGIHAGGFEVEDTDRVKANAESGGEPLPPSELQVADSDHNLIDVSTRSFAVPAEKSPYPVRHIALYTADPKRLSNFYGTRLG
jgi:hypothetical protein